MPTSKIFYHKEYYLQNKEKIKNYNKSFRQSNKEYFKNYREKNIEHLKSYYKKYYDKNLKRPRKNTIISEKLPNFRKINESIILIFD